jgi:sulfur carrier protein ThiS
MVSFMEIKRPANPACEINGALPTESGMLARGFVVVVNDDVVRADREPIAVKDGDEVCLLAALAGG